MAGDYVALWVHAHVTSKALAAWGASQPAMPWDTTVRDFVAGGQLGNLQAKPTWLDWNLAHPASRASVLDEVIATIERLALPYFAAFENLPDLVARVRPEDPPGIDPVDAIEVLLCFAGRPAAQRYLERFLSERPAIASEYRAALHRFHSEGLPSARTNHARDLAATTLVRSLAA